MHRTDPVLIELDELLSTNSKDTNNIQSDIQSREKALAPVYLQIAHEFADLHDRAGRMKAKGCISEVLEWKRSREFFYWRILRRLKEDNIKQSISSIYDNKLGNNEITQKFIELFPESLRTHQNDFTLKANKEIVEWLNSNSNAIDSYLSNIKKEFIRQNVLKLIKELTPEEKNELLK
mmetsp:Transcript_24054/g.21873  ORF Transcript_24054/g.21873 Transcript_24054/m.21873 type:complete len:178 (+) Transcript_24054:2508-3041(+)